MTSRDPLDDESSYDVQVRTHDRVIKPRQPARQAPAEGLAADTNGDDQPEFRFDIRKLG